MCVCECVRVRVRVYVYVCVRVYMKNTGYAYKEIGTGYIWRWGRR